MFKNTTDNLVGTLESKWLPNKITNLLAWFESSKKYLIISNDSVSTWLDKSGNLNHANSIPGREPTFNDNILNNYPALLFNNSVMEISNITLSGFTVICVFKSSNNNSIYQFNNSVSTNGLTLTNKKITVTKNGFRSSKNITTQISNNFNITLHEYNYTHSSHILYVNQYPVALTTETPYSSNPGSLDTSYSFFIGAGYNYIGMNGYIAEFLLFNRVLTYNEKYLIYTYLNKYLI